MAANVALALDEGSLAILLAQARCGTLSIEKFETVRGVKEEQVSIATTAGLVEGMSKNALKKLQKGVKEKPPKDEKK
jgi:ABC-type spermidine/putrescine transport system permease subunit II